MRTPIIRNQLLVRTLSSNMKLIYRRKLIFFCMKVAFLECKFSVRVVVLTQYGYGNWFNHRHIHATRQSPLKDYFHFFYLIFSHCFTSHFVSSKLLHIISCCPFFSLFNWKIFILYVMRFSKVLL